jgi:hypothetical protein
VKPEHDGPELEEICHPVCRQGDRFTFAPEEDLLGLAANLGPRFRRDTGFRF